MIFSDAFALCRTALWEPAGLDVEAPQPEAESADYAACISRVNGAAIRFRLARVTPTKIGQFVTLWQRSAAGPIAPFDLADGVDYFVVATLAGASRGAFVFPLAELAAQGVVSRAGAGGKRAIRVYPPWDRPVARQAIQTQRWQGAYFLDFSESAALSPARVRSLFGA